MHYKVKKLIWAFLLSNVFSF